MINDYFKLCGIKVFLEWQNKRHYVGLLSKIKNRFCFQYDAEYMSLPIAVDLGPEMPFRKARYLSKELFIPFADRIPPRDGYGYPDYCRDVNISVEETNPFVLLSTLAHRGPSCFIFEAFYESSFTIKDLHQFRKSLDLKLPEFCDLFDLPYNIIQNKKDSRHPELLKRAQIYASYPAVALKQLVVKKGGVIFEKWFHAYKILKAKGISQGK